MGENYNLWRSFWQNFDEFKKAVSQNAKRANLSEEATLVLVAIFEFNGLKIDTAEYILNELSQKGLVKIENAEINITSKGSILAKSFAEALKKC